MNFFNILFVLLIGFSASLAPLFISLNLYFLIPLLLLPIAVLLLLTIPYSKKNAPNFSYLLIGFYFFSFTVWPNYCAYRLPGLPAINPTRLIFFFSILMALIFVALYKDTFIRFKSRLKNLKVEISLIALIFIGHLIAVSLSKYKITALTLTFREFFQTVVIGILAIILVKDSSSACRIIRIILIATLILTGFTIVESYLHRSLFVGIFPVTDDYMKSAMVELVRGGGYRAKGTFDSPLLLVDYFVTVLPLAFGVLFAKKIFDNKTKFLSLILIVFIPIAIGMSGSRSGIIIPVIEFLLFGILVTYKLSANSSSHRVTYFPWQTLGLILLIIITTLVAYPFISDIIMGNNINELGSTMARVKMFENFVSHFLNGDIWGHGFGIGISEFGIKHQNIFILDNYYLSLFADSGVVATFGFVLLICYVIKKYFKSMMAELTPIWSIYAGILTGVVGFSLLKLISSQTQIFPIFYFYIFLLPIFNKDFKSR